MTVEQKPVRHARDHAPGGADPIPGPGGLSVAFPDSIAEISLAHPGDLLGYWRLGEPTAPFADTSVLTSGLSPAAPATFNTPGGSPPLVTTDITGALPPADDDGAVEFTGSGGGSQQTIKVTEVSPARFNWGPSQPDITIACWVKPHASGSTFDTHIVSSWSHEISGPATPYGYALSMSFPTRILYWSRGDRGTGAGGTGAIAVVNSAALPADEWSFIVGTYSAATGHKLYVNGALVGTSSTVFNTSNPVNNGIQFGRNQDGGLNTFYGGLDEVSVWGACLSDIEVGTLFTAGIGETGDPGAVLTSAGDGTTSWAFPTVKVDGTRYDEILAGTGLSTTDNTDGTVTLDATGGGTPGGTAGGALDGTYPNPGIAASVAGAGLAETTNVLSVNVDGTTIEISSDTLRIKADGVTANEIAANAVGSSELAATTVTAGSYGDATHIPTFTVDADGRLTAASSTTFTAGGTSPADTAGWMPLTTVTGGVPDLVWDSTDSLIPTYGPF